MTSVVKASANASVTRETARRRLITMLNADVRLAQEILGELEYFPESAGRMRFGNCLVCLPGLVTPKERRIILGLLALSMPTTLKQWSLWWFQSARLKEAGAR